MKDLEKRNSVFHFICSPHEMEQCFLAFYYLLYGSAVLIYPTVPVSVGKATWAPRWLNQEKLGGGAEELSTPPCWRSTEKPVDFNNKSWWTSQCLTGAASSAVKKMKAECACTKKSQQALQESSLDVALCFSLWGMCKKTCVTPQGTSGSSWRSCVFS